MALINFRPLGGDPRFGIYRSGTFTLLSSEDIPQLLSLMPATYIDLRGPSEELTSPLPAIFHQTGIQRLSLPIHQANHQFGTLIAPTEKDYVDLYLKLLRENKEIVRSFFELIGRLLNQKIILGCSAGKDRTGVLSALMLAAADWPQLDIVKDFHTSASFLISHADYFSSIRKNPAITPAEYRRRFTLSSNIMRDFLLAIQDEFGSATTYLKTIGVSDQVLSALKSRLSLPESR